MQLESWVLQFSSKRQGRTDGANNHFLRLRAGNNESANKSVIAGVDLEPGGEVGQACPGRGAEGDGDIVDALVAVRAGAIRIHPANHKIIAGIYGHVRIGAKGRAVGRGVAVERGSFRLICGRTPIQRWNKSEAAGIGTIGGGTGFDIADQ